MYEAKLEFPDGVWGVIGQISFVGGGGGGLWTFSGTTHFFNITDTEIVSERSVLVLRGFKAQL